MKKSILILALLAAGLSTMMISPGASANPTLVASAPAGACRWLSSNGATESYHTVFTDLDQTPLADLRFGEPYGPTRPAYSTLAGSGFLDFDGDQRADVFRALPGEDGLFHWQYLASGSQGWGNLNYATLALTDLRFGDFSCRRSANHAFTKACRSHTERQIEMFPQVLQTRAHHDIASLHTIGHGTGNHA